MEQEIINPEKQISNLNISIFCYKGQFTINNTTFSYDEEQCYLKFNSSTIHISYQNIISFGKNDLDLIIFVKTENQDDDEEDDEKDYSLFELIQSKINDTNEQHYNMIGPYTLKVNFQAHNKQTLQKTFEDISIKSTQYDENNGNQGNEEGEQQDQDQMEFDMDQMITADDIDENGNIIKDF